MGVVEARGPGELASERPGAEGGGVTAAEDGGHWAGERLLSS